MTRLSEKDSRMQKCRRGSLPSLYNRIEGSAELSFALGVMQLEAQRLLIIQSQGGAKRCGRALSLLLIPS